MPSSTEQKVVYSGLCLIKCLHLVFFNGFRYRIDEYKIYCKKHDGSKCGVKTRDLEPSRLLFHKRLLAFTLR